MAVKRAINHSWSSPAALIGEELTAIYKNSSFRPMIRRALWSYETVLPSAAPQGIAFANLVKSSMDKAASATNAGAVGLRQDEYSLFIQNFTNGYSGYGNSAFIHPDDAIPAWKSAFPGLAGNQGPFVENGIAEWKAWGDAFLISFKDKLDELNMPYPSRFHFDVENSIGPFQSVLSFGPAPESTPYTGWMDYAYNDPRAETELVDGIKTFKQLVDEWVPLVGGGGVLTWDNSKFFWDGSNRNLREFMEHINLRIRDHILNETFMKKAQELFPGTTWGNWEHGKLGSRENVALSRGKGSQRRYEEASPHSDWTSLVHYPLRGASIQDSGSRKSDWANILGIQFRNDGPPYDDDYGLFWTTLVNQTTENSISILGSPDRYCPWMTFEGESYALGQFRDGVDLVTISSSDANKFSVGNQITLRNNDDTLLYTANIVRIVDLGNGSHRININSLSPTSEADFPNVTKARDTIISQDANVTSVVSEPSYTYNTRQQDIQTVIDKCIELGVTEYIFWQNTSGMASNGWDRIAENISRIEEGLGVRLGEALRPVIEPSGTNVTIKFDPPANGPWILSHLVIDPSKKPTIMEGTLNLPYREITNENLSIDDSGRLVVSLEMASATITSDAEINVRIHEGWITDEIPQFRNSATTNVTFGINANPATGVILAVNTSNVTPPGESPPEMPDNFANGPSISLARLKRTSPSFSINNQSFQTRQINGMISPINTLIFNSSATIAFGTNSGSNVENLEVRYTINGGVPTKRSPMYVNPIVLNKNISNGQKITIQAKIFDKNSIRSGKLLKMDIIIN